MTIGIAAFIAFRQANYTTVVARYQSYWPDSTVDSHSFYPFTTDAIAASSTGGQDSIGVTFALSQQIVQVIEQALSANYLVEVSFYSFTPTATGQPPSSKTLFATFIGELVSATQNEASIAIQVGSSLGSVEAQAPPRKFTTALIGKPPKL